MLPPIRVLVVDDSPFMCRAITRMVSEQPGLEVAGTARNGVEALERIAELHPDVVTLDVEMPVMDGLTALERILAGPRTPVVMLSARTQVGSETTLRALELGAFDFVAKPESAMVDIFLVARELVVELAEDLCDRRIAAGEIAEVPDFDVVVGDPPAGADPGPVRTVAAGEVGVVLDQHSSKGTARELRGAREPLAPSGSSLEIRGE